MQNLDPSSLNGLLSGNTTSLIPESFMSAMTIGFIVLNVIGLLFLVIYIFGEVRKWKVQSAVLGMQKDVSEIKQLLASKNEKAPVLPKDTSAPTDEPA